MKGTGTLARVLRLGIGQNGLFTTAQAEKSGISRLTLARYTNEGVIQRVERGIYAVPGAVDEYTPLLALWISFDPTTMPNDRPRDWSRRAVFSHTTAAWLHGLGDFPHDIPELTMPEPTKTRRAVRLHFDPLRKDEVTFGPSMLRVTKPARTIVDVLRDGHDPTRVAAMAADGIGRGRVWRADLEAELDVLAPSQGYASGAHYLEALLDLVEFSGPAIMRELVVDDIGKSLMAAGQLQAVKALMRDIRDLDREPEPPSEGAAARGRPGRLDVYSYFHAGDCDSPVDTRAPGSLGPDDYGWLEPVIRPPSTAPEGESGDRRGR